MVFWISTLLMSAFAMGFICLPMWRSNSPSKSEFENEQKLYKARISEVETELEIGRIDEASAEALKAEEARRLIKVSEKTSASLLSSNNKLPIILAALSLPLISIPFYYNTGYPELVSKIEKNADANTPPTMSDLLRVAEKSLEENPDDANGWKAVAPVYVRMSRYDDAIKAYENILRVEGRKPEFLIKLADVYIEKTKGQIDQSAKQLIDETLKIDENNPIATFYTGIHALQAGREDETRRIWQGMIDGAKGDENWYPIIKDRLNKLALLKENKTLSSVNEEAAATIKELEPDEQIAMIAQMVSNLEDKLADDPENKEGWAMLIRSYTILGRNEDAKKAFAKAIKIYPEDTAFENGLKQIMDQHSNNSNGQTQ